MTDFQMKVREVVRQIPRGSTASYQTVAILAGSPRAYRAVATIMANNLDPAIPCHRVIKSNGSPGDYNRGGEEAKRAILRSEGVII